MLFVSDRYIVVLTSKSTRSQNALSDSATRDLLKNLKRISKRFPSDLTSHSQFSFLR